MSSGPALSAVGSCGRAAVGGRRGSSSVVVTEPAGQVADELRRFVSTKSGAGLLNGSRGRTERSGPWCPRSCDYLVPLAAVLVMRNRYGASRVSTAPLAMFEITTVKLSFVEHWVKDWETVELLKR